MVKSQIVGRNMTQYCQHYIVTLGLFRLVLLIWSRHSVQEWSDRPMCRQHTLMALRWHAAKLWQTRAKLLKL